MTRQASPHPAVRSTSVHLPLMLALTFSTGIVDAVGYLGLHRVFTGNMTGNVVVLGMGLTGADGLPVAGPVVALIGFLAGAVFAGRLLRHSDDGWSLPTTGVFAAVAAMLSALAVVLLVDPEPSYWFGLVVTGVMGAAMGAQAGAARHVGVKDVTTVVVTSTLTGLAADSALGSGKGAQLRRRGTAVVLILLGAAVGAALLQVHKGLGVLVAAVVVGVVTYLGHRDYRAGV